MKNKNPGWFDMNLSELVEKSLKMGVIPFFQFLDKDKVVIGESEGSLSPSDETPITVLKKQIRLYETIIKKIQTRDGIISDSDSVDERLMTIESNLTVKIKEFQQAVNMLNNEQEVHECDATGDAQSGEAGNTKN